MTKKNRLDALLLERGLARNKREAEALLLAGEVFVDGQRREKAGNRYPPDCEIDIRRRRGRFVSRGGEKLEGALETLGISVIGHTCVDLGASTGGFTDCLLKRGARRVYAFDVGCGQLDWTLRQDPRVEVRDRFNVRLLSPGDVGEPVDLITADLSFISLRKILPVLRGFPSSRFLLLVKPQFEARTDEVEPGGLITDKTKREEIIGRFRLAALQEGFEVLGETPSPIPGQKGNWEFFFYLAVAARQSG